MAKKTAKKSAKRKPAAKTGRPAGAKSKKRVATHTVKTACPKCASTKRTNFAGNPIVVNVPCLNPQNGKTYAGKTGRRTQCADCGQHRVEWTYEREVKDGERPS